MAGRLTGQALIDLSKLTSEYLFFMKNKCNVDFSKDSDTAESTVLSKCIGNVLENLVSRHNDFKIVFDNFNSDVNANGYTKISYANLYKSCIKVVNLDAYKDDIDIILIMCAVITSFSNKNEIEKTKAYFLKKIETYGIPYDKQSQLLLNVSLWNYNYEDYRSVLNEAYESNCVSLKIDDNIRDMSDQQADNIIGCFTFEDLPFSRISSTDAPRSIKTLVVDYFRVITKSNFFENQIVFIPVLSLAFFFISTLCSKNPLLFAAPLCLLWFLLSERGDINSSKTPIPNTVLTSLTFLSAIINVIRIGNVLMFVVAVFLALLTALQWIAVKKSDCKQIVKTLILYVFPFIIVFSVVIVFLGVSLFSSGMGLISYGIGMMCFLLVQYFYYSLLLPINNTKINIPIIFVRNMLIKRKEKVMTIRAEADRINDRIKKAQSKTSVFDSAANTNVSHQDNYQNGNRNALVNNSDNQNQYNQGHTISSNTVQNNVNDNLQTPSKSLSSAQYESNHAAAKQKADDDARRAAMAAKQKADDDARRAAMAAKQKADDDARRAAAAKQKAEDDARRAAVAKQKAEDDADRIKRISVLENEFGSDEEKDRRNFEKLYLNGQAYESFTDEERARLFMANCIKLYEEKLKGTWSNCGGAIMSDTHALNYINSFTYTGSGLSQNCSSWTVTPFLTADETGKCYLLIKAIDGSGYLKKSSMGEIAFSSDNKFFTMNCTDGSVFVFCRS